MCIVYVCLWYGNVCGIVCNACKRKEVVCCCVQLAPNTLTVQPGHPQLFQEKPSETETRDMQAQLEENFGQSTSVRFVLAC